MCFPYRLHRMCSKLYQAMWTTSRRRMQLQSAHSQLVRRLHICNLYAHFWLGKCYSWKKIQPSCQNWNLRQWVPMLPIQIGIITAHECVHANGSVQLWCLSQYNFLSWQWGSMALQDSTIHTLYKINAQSLGKYSPLIMWGRPIHEQPLRSYFPTKILVGKTNLDLWLDRSVCPKDLSTSTCLDFQLLWEF